MSLVKEILKSISDYPGGYKMIYSLLYERVPSRKTSESSIKGTLSRLKKNGLIDSKNNSWHITQLGKEILTKKNSRPIHFIKEKSKIGKAKTMIVIFDIPEKKRKYRDWLRYELVDFGFEFVQQSVWFGPPLPKEFIVYLEKEKILQYIKFFRVHKEDLI